jgi:hypothetical protein
MTNPALSRLKDIAQRSKDAEKNRDNEIDREKPEKTRQARTDETETLELGEDDMLENSQHEDHRNLDSLKNRGERNEAGETDENDVESIKSNDEIETDIADNQSESEDVDEIEESTERNAKNEEGASEEPALEEVTPAPDTEASSGTLDTPRETAPESASAAPVFMQQEAVDDEQVSMINEAVHLLKNGTDSARNHEMRSVSDLLKGKTLPEISLPITSVRDYPEMNNALFERKVRIGEVKGEPHVILTSIGLDNIIGGLKDIQESIAGKIKEVDGVIQGYSQKLVQLNEQRGKLESDAERYERSMRFLVDLKSRLD